MIRKIASATAMVARSVVRAATSKAAVYNASMICACASVVGGVWMIHVPSALIVGGALIIALTILEDRRAGR